MLVNLKQKSNSGIEYYSRTDSCANFVAKLSQWSTLGKKFWLSTHPKKFGNHVTVSPPDRLTDRPSAPQVYQCKTTQSTGMATQMQLEFILAGNRIATGVL